MDKPALRSNIKSQRLSLSGEQQRLHAQSIAEQVCSQDFFKQSEHIAFYLPVQGEVDTRMMVEKAKQLGKHCYLPVLSPDGLNQLCFMPFDDNTTFVSNRFNIPEPALDKARLIAAEDLDLVITPLVAFDARCHRIGMGAGFYDRSFAFLQSDPRPIKPILCGLAYAFQQVEDTEPQSWDIPLDYVTTQEKIYVAYAI